MKTKFIAAALALSSFAIFWSPAVAEDDAFSKGAAAYQQEEYADAATWFRIAAKQGNVNAQIMLGGMYFQGKGVLEDDAEAVKWYRLAAEQGHVDAQFILGYRYARGNGVPENDTEAVKWYRMAAEQGSAAAQFNLGSMYRNGQGVPQDFIECYKWYNLAAAQGSELAIGGKKVMRELMTSAQIAEAQKLSAAWKPVGER